MWTGAYAEPYEIGVCACCCVCSLAPVVSVQSRSPLGSRSDLHPCSLVLPVTPPSILQGPAARLCSVAQPGCRFRCQSCFTHEAVCTAGIDLVGSGSSSQNIDLVRRYAIAYLKIHSCISPSCCAYIHRKMDAFSPPSWATTDSLPTRCSDCILEVLKDGAVVEKLSIGRNATYTFGRAADAVDFAVFHATASRRHCALVWGVAPGASVLGLYALDLGSTHGTFLGRGASRKRLEANVPVQLHTGSTLSFGESTRLYLLVGVPEPTDLVPAPSPPPVDAQTQQATLQDSSAGVSWGIMDAEPDQLDDEQESMAQQEATGGGATGAGPSGSRKRARGEEASFTAGGKRSYLRELADDGPVVEESDAPREFSGDASAVLSMLGGGRGAGGGGEVDTGPLAWMDKLDHKQLTDKEKTSLDKIRAKMLRIKSITVECERIRAKEGTQGGLSEGQQGQLDRNEGLIEDLEQEVEAQAEELRNRMESRRPGCTGMPVQAADKNAAPYSSADRGMAMEDDELYSRTIDRTASMAAGRSKATYVLSRGRFGVAARPSALPGASAPSVTPFAPATVHVPAGKVETEASLLASLRGNRKEMQQLARQEEETQRGRSTASLGDDEIAAALAAAEAREASEAREKRRVQLQQLQAEAQRLEGLLDIVNADWRAKMTVVEEKVEVKAAPTAHPQLSNTATASAAPPIPATITGSVSTVTERSSHPPATTAPAEKMAPPPPPQPPAFRPAAGAPGGHSTSKSSSGLSSLLATRIAAAAGAGAGSSARPQGEETVGEPSQSQQTGGEAVPAKKKNPPPLPAASKYDSDDVVDLSRLV